MLSRSASTAVSSRDSSSALPTRSRKRSVWGRRSILTSRRELGLRPPQFDRSQNLVFNYIYELPKVSTEFGLKALGYVLDRWQSAASPPSRAAHRLLLPSPPPTAKTSPGPPSRLASTSRGTRRSPRATRPSTARSTPAFSASGTAQFRQRRPTACCAAPASTTGMSPSAGVSH